MRDPEVNLLVHSALAVGFHIIVKGVADACAHKILRGSLRLVGQHRFQHVASPITARDGADGSITSDNLQVVHEVVHEERTLRQYPLGLGQRVCAPLVCTSLQVMLPLLRIQVLEDRRLIATVQYF